MQASELFLEEFRRRGERAASQRIGRDEMLSEAAHDAYQAATDRLTRDHHWDDERALVVMRGLNAAVGQWLAGGAADWQELETMLHRQESELERGYGRPQGGPGAGYR
jgi:hypothetical protein